MAGSHSRAQDMGAIELKRPKNSKWNCNFIRSPEGDVLGQAAVKGDQSGSRQPTLSVVAPWPRRFQGEGPWIQVVHARLSAAAGIASMGLEDDLAGKDYGHASPQRPSPAPHDPVQCAEPVASSQNTRASSIRNTMMLLILNITVHRVRSITPRPPPPNTKAN
jgi:hypothetical protein